MSLNLCIYINGILFAFQIVRELRGNLNLQLIAQAKPSPSKDSRNTNSSNRATAQVLTVNSLRFGITLTKVVAEAWINIIDGVRVASEHKSLDIIMLLMIHGIPRRRKRVEMLIRNKIRSGLINEALLEKTFSCHLVVRF